MPGLGYTCGASILGETGDGTSPIRNEIVMPLKSNRLSAAERKQTTFPAQSERDQWRKPLANRTRELRSGLHLRPPSEKRQLDLIDEFPGVASLRSGQAQPKATALQPWAPVVSPWAVPPVAGNFLQWIARYHMNKLAKAAMPIAPTTALLAPMVATYGLLSFSAECCRIVNGPLTRYWQEDALRRFLAQAEADTQVDARVWAIQANRIKRATAYSSVALRDITEATQWVYNVIDNCLAAGTAISSLSMPFSSIAAPVIGAPAIGVLILFATQRFWQKHFNEEEYDTEQKVRSLEAVMNDNIQLPNKYNREIWSHSLQEARALHFNAWAKRVASQAASEIFLTALNTGAIMGAHWHGVPAQDFSQTGNASLAGIVTDVRSANDLSHRATELVKDASGFLKRNARLTSLQNTTRDLPEAAWKSRSLMMLSRSGEIQIVVNGQTANTADIIRSPGKHLRKPGRVSISGPNGSGKTTLMSHLAHAVGDNAHYEPVESLLSYDWRGGSAGENTIEHIAEIIEHVTSKISDAGQQAPTIFLDEWPANLSGKNRALMSAVIDELAQRHCVVEIVHFDEDAIA